mgnify:CR=1 FL=1
MPPTPKTQGRVGRKREIESDEWAHLTFMLPRAMMIAFENYLHAEGRRLGRSQKKGPFLRDWLERVLVEAGYLRITVKEDQSATVKSYEAVEPPSQGRGKGRR